ncbi:MAG: bacteriophage holin [Candidatus Omnitrophica bacterium]|nr:bacteriophage holin [Candidatus Omnitrophota bacterium]MDE2009756.1 bacteriophage holin [Candidatus Omnitrophota bacterium]MDE2232382.1 bacteriophage holin [Candidatus Omnitrophota bacterium]
MNGKLDIKAFGLAGGILWSAGVFIMGISAMTCGYCAKFVAALGTFYIGYSATIPGSIFGAAWAFLDAGIGCAVFAWLYNRLAK